MSDLPTATDLGMRPNGRITTRVVIGSTIAAAVATAAALAAGPVLPELLELLPILMTAAATAAAAAALLLHTLTTTTARGHERWAAAAFGVTAVTMWMQVVGFPAIDLDGGPFRTTDSGAASLYFVWHTVLPLFVLVACTGVSSSRIARQAATGTALLAAVWLAIGSLPGPTWFAPDQTYLPSSYVMMLLDLSLTVAALACWVRRTGPHPLWTEAAVTAALVFTGWDVGLRTLGTERFTSWWWASLVMRVASVAVPMLWLALGAAALQRRLHAYADDLEQSYDVQVDANRALADHNDDLDAFARTVAHDLRTPLTASTGLVETVLLHHELPEQARTMLDRALVRQRDQAAMLDGLLRLARAGDGPLGTAPVALARIVADVVQRTDLAADVRVSSPHTVLADTAALGAVLQNLLTNAVAYAGPSRTPRIEVSSTGTADGRVEICVDDDGPGIPEELREQVFGVFERGVATDGRGAGLGLSIVRRLVERHGGTIVAEAAPTGGARFRFDLPRARVGASTSGD